jgi:hypothetical protein
MLRLDRTAPGEAYRRYVCYRTESDFISELFFRVKRCSNRCRFAWRVGPPRNGYCKGCFDASGSDRLDQQALAIAAMLHEPVAGPRRDQLLQRAVRTLGRIDLYHARERSAKASWRVENREHRSPLSVERPLLGDISMLAYRCLQCPVRVELRPCGWDAPRAVGDRAWELPRRGSDALH